MTTTASASSPPPSASNDLRRQARRNVLATLIGRAATIGLNIIATLWVIHYLGPGRYGLFVMLVSVITLLDLTTELSLFEIAVREIAKFEDQASDWLGATTVLRAWIALALGALMLIVPLFLPPGTADAATIRMSALLFIANSLRTPVTYFRARLLIHWELGLLALARAAELGFIALAIRAHAGTAALMGAKAAAMGLFVIALWIVLLRGYRVRLHAGRKVIGPLVKLSIPVGITAILLQLQLKGDLLLIGSFLGQAAAGRFGAVAQIPEFVLVATTVLVATVGPVLARCVGRSETARFQTIFQEVFDGLLLAVPPICAIATWFAPAIIRVAFGEAYLGGVPEFRLIVWVGGMIPLAAHLGVTAMTLNLQRRLVNVELVNVVVYLLGNLLFMPWTGTVASAWTRLIVVLIGPVRTYLVIRRGSTCRLSARYLALSLPLTAITLGIAIVLPLPPALAGAIALIVYALAVTAARKLLPHSHLSPRRPGEH